MMLENAAKKNPDVFVRFTESLQEREDIRLHSLHLVGSILTDDFRAGQSTIDSVLVLESIDSTVLAAIAALGRQFHAKDIAAPYLMTPSYIQESLDVFPIEFFNFQLLHQTVLGSDVFADLVIHKEDLRKQCEREIKSKYLWLQQGYIKCLGEASQLHKLLAASITDYLPLFRALLKIGGIAVPANCEEVVTGLNQLTSFDTSVFERVFAERHSGAAVLEKEMDTVFDQYLLATQQLMVFIDALSF